MEHQPVYVIAKWKVNPQHLPTVLIALGELSRQSKAEPGNLQYNVYQSEEDQHIIMLHEVYRDEQAAHAHRQSRHFQDLALGTIVPLLAEREVIRLRPLVTAQENTSANL